MAQNKDPYKIDGGYKKTIAQLQEEALEEAKKAEQLVSEQNKRLKSYDVVSDVFETSNKNKNLNRSVVSSQDNFELNKNKTLSALVEQQKRDILAGNGSRTDLKIIQREATTVYAVYNKKTDEYVLGYKDAKGREHVVHNVKLDKEDISNLKHGEINRGVSDRRIFFKGRVAKSLYQIKDKAVLWVRKNTIFKGRVNAVISRFTARARSSARRVASKYITQPIKAAFNKLTGNLTAKLGQLLSKFSSSLAAFFANPYVLGAIAVIALIFLVWEAFPVFIFEPETSKTVGYGESEKTTYEFLNRNYEEWSNIAETYSKRYGVYFNVTDAFAIGVTGFPDLLFDTEDKDSFKEYFDFGYNVSSGKYAENVFMSMLGPMETRVEYHHRIWSDWTIKVSSRPSADQVREYKVTEKVWVEPVSDSITYCTLFDFGYQIKAINGECPIGFTKDVVEIITPGYWKDEIVTYWDYRNILESWWDTNKTNVANMNDGVTNTGYYTYFNAGEPKLEKPTCKDCKIINRTEVNGNYVRDVDYWTLLNWDELAVSLNNKKPNGESFLNYFNYSTPSNVATVDVKKYVTYLGTLTVPSNDKDYSINTTHLYLDFYKDLDYRKVSIGYNDSEFENYIDNLNNIRLLFADYFGSGEYNISLLGKFLKPVQSPHVTSYSSRFGMRYIDGKWVFHRGLDITSISGLNTPIISVMDGGIVEKTFNGCPTYGNGYGDECGGTDNYTGTGNHVVVRYNVIDNDGNRVPLYVLYAHLKQDSILVKKGDSVNTDTVLGFMGSSGSSTGIHLHLATYVINSDGSSGFMNPEFMIQN